MVKSIFPKRGLIVSCQALPDEPLYGNNIMVHMALAAEQGGAVGIRTNGIKDISGIKKAVKIPVIGLIKREIPGSDIYITPTMEEVKAILDAGAEIVALDMTDREQRLIVVAKMIEYIHNAGALVMADISTFDEGVKAEELGVDFVSTTLSGYTSNSPQQKEPDLQLVRDLSAVLNTPVVAEGRIWSPIEAAEALKSGAEYVVVGSAITRPQLITRKYIDFMAEWLV